MIKAIIIEDEPRLAASLQTMLQRYCPQVQVAGMAANADKGIDMIKSHAPHLVFLDIAMPGKNAFAMLKELTAVDFEIIFTTAYSTYAVQAFKYSAVDYLLKPVDEEELVQAVARVAARLGQNNSNRDIETLAYNLAKKISPAEQKISLPSLNGFIVIKLQDILYCEADGAYTNFYLAVGKVICASRPIIDFEQLLAEGNFFRIHRSFLINMNHVSSYAKGEGGTVTMTDQKELEVSRRKKELFLVKMKEFFSL